MTREQAINYLTDTGLSPEQVMEIVEALGAEPCEDTVTTERKSELTLWTWQSKHSLIKAMNKVIVKVIVMA